jgi:hypothetical protein
MTVCGALLFHFVYISSLIHMNQQTTLADILN